MFYDSIIIGFGKGGKTLAAFLANKGEKVALIEKSSSMYGGTCINVGCIPSKSLVKNSEISASHLNHGNYDGQSFYAKAIEEKRSLVSMLRSKNYAKLDSIDKIDIIDGFASFIDNTHIKVDTGTQDLLIEGKKIFINTGATPIIPNIEGVENNPNVFTSESLMDLDILPKKLTIIGGGYIGLEFASMYAGFGTEVTILNKNDSFLPREDKDIAEEILEILKSRNIQVINSVQILKIVDNSIVFTIEDEEKTIEDTVILLATGRKANIDKLGLENTDVIIEKGLIAVDDKLRTNANNIWALGDVSSRLQFTYISLDDYRIVVSDLYGDGSYSLKERKNVPYSVFISTPYSRVGLNETEAGKQGYNFRVLKMPVAMVPKAHVLGKTAGLLKAIVDVDTNKILGAMLISDTSHEVINTIRLAMQLEADYTVLRDSIFTHPTITESLNDLFSL